MSPRRRLLVIVGALAAILVAGIMVVAVRGDRLAANRVAQDQPGPVLLVPGYGGGTQSLDRFADALRADGRDAVVVSLVGDGTGDLRLQAEALGDAADRLLDAGAPSVDVIGFSAGGVVSRIWADDLGGAAVARRIVTLGSPHHGADVAGIGAAFVPGACPEACRQLVTGSDLLVGLAEAPAGPRWISIWTDQDEVVTPPDSARLGGAVNVEVHDVCADADVGHGDLPTDPFVVGLVALALDVDPLDAAPTAAHCDALRAAGRALVSS
ncbi:MAG: esterase/lipase family protein [Jiangellaceae bacterium]